ncbi:hypothetical protein AZ21_2220 [Bordetella bronchiseptica B20-10725633]|nr:hypothetical protein AZ21_3796 [Bordetella bronchiseptica B20-10725633]KDB70750.1 hypothetical protein AZ21_1760 [Bordetella bronchiseptica B20-10725633]KDB73060.1 hypothetical protein AZ21_2220 [Bordetella bronchiseptica B20-10725633]
MLAVDLFSSQDDGEVPLWNEFFVYHFSDSFHSDVAKIVRLRVRHDVDAFLVGEVAGSLEDAPCAMSDIRELLKPCFSAAPH